MELLLIAVIVLQIFALQIFTVKGFSSQKQAPPNTVLVKKSSSTVLSSSRTSTHYDRTLMEHKAVLSLSADIERTAEELPSLKTIKEFANNIERTPTSKTFCWKTGGYPDRHIQKSLYSYIWKNQELKSKVKEASKKRAAVKTGSKEDLQTFGLI